MTKYKIVKMNTTNGIVFTVNRVDKTPYGDELIPVRPIKYYKTRTGAMREIRRLMGNN